jgi:phosphocarrier protein HPr
MHSEDIMPEITLTIKNKVGLHARPASLFVKEASKYRCNIQISKNNCTEANGKSILGVLSLGADCGSIITVRADGVDAEKALTAIKILTENKFGEQE